MKAFSFITILFFFFILIGTVNSQSLLSDSLLQQLKNEKNDSIKISLYKKAGKFLFKNEESDSAYYYLKKGIQNKGVNIYEKALKRNPVGSNIGINNLFPHLL